VRRLSAPPRVVRATLPAWAARADLALFRWSAALHAPILDRVLPPLSRSADHGRLWMGVATALAATGRRSGRRAALRGLLALALASAVANLPAKLALRRPRPPLDLVPVARHLSRLPVTWSLPSGHSASAAAFATGVALESRRAAGPVAALAAAVGFSRVYTGVHYPGDVVVGAAIGVAAAVTTTRFWPRPPDLPALHRHRRHAPGQACPDGDGVVICVNRVAGPAPTQDPADDLRRALPAADVRRVDPADLRETLVAAAGSATVLGVAGGDGSMNAGAGVAHEHGLPLLAVPAGTLNHLARDLGLAEDGDAVAALRRGDTALVDIALAGDRPFCNGAAIGSYVALVDVRERLEARIGKWPALLVGLVIVLHRERPVRLEVDGRPRSVWMLFVGNCRYHPMGFAPSWRERLDDGLLDVRMVDGDQPWARMRLVLAVLTGRLSRCGAYREWTARELRLRSLDGPLRLALDGETVDGPDALLIRKADRPLAVYAPGSDAGD
jgi:diacylglycerol kinase family enzyme/membrane-associated phospholipid phosphatase